VAVPAAHVGTKATVHGSLSVGLRRLLGPDYRMGYLFITPIFCFVLSLVAYPFGYAIYLSMTHKLVGLPLEPTGYAAQSKIHTRNFVGPSGKIYVGSKQGYPSAA